MSDAREPVYRTTTSVKCDWCGAKPGEDCHIEPGRWRGIGPERKLHTCRVDPTSDPVGYMDPPKPGFIRTWTPVPTTPAATLSEEELAAVRVIVENDKSHHISVWIIERLLNRLDKAEAVCRVVQKDITAGFKDYERVRTLTAWREAKG